MGKITISKVIEENYGIECCSYMEYKRIFDGFHKKVKDNDISFFTSVDLNGLLTCSEHKPLYFYKTKDKGICVSFKFYGSGCIDSHDVITDDTTTAGADKDGEKSLDDLEKLSEKICEYYADKMCSATIPTEDKINHPSHYTYGEIEVISVIEDWELNYNIGNCIKYLGRYKHKGNAIQDLEKARWYLDREIENLKKEHNDEQ